MKDTSPEHDSQDQPAGLLAQDPSKAPTDAEERSGPPEQHNLPIQAVVREAVVLSPLTVSADKKKPGPRQDEIGGPKNTETKKPHPPRQR